MQCAYINKCVEETPQNIFATRHPLKGKIAKNNTHNLRQAAEGDLRAKGLAPHLSKIKADSAPNRALLGTSGWLGLEVGVLSGEYRQNLPDSGSSSRSMREPLLQ